MNRTLRAESVRSGDISKMVALAAVIAMIAGLGYWAFKDLGHSLPPAPKSTDSLTRWTEQFV